MFKIWLQNWFKNKLNIVLTVFVAGFVLFAFLSYLWQPFVYVSMFFLSLGLVVFGVSLQKKHKVLKKQFANAHPDVPKYNLRLAKRNLQALKFQFIMIYALSLSMIYYLISQLIKNL